MIRKAVCTYVVLISFILGTNHILKAQGLYFRDVEAGQGSNEEIVCILVEGIWYDPVSRDTLSLGPWPKCEGHSSLCDSDFTYITNPSLVEGQSLLGVWDITKTSFDSDKLGCLSLGHHLCSFETQGDQLRVQCTGEAPRVYDRFL